MIRSQMQKETLSISTPNQKPKIELPDKKLVGVKPSDPKEPKKLENLGLLIKEEKQ